MIENGEHHGKLLINIGLSPVVSKNIIVDVRNVRSVVSLNDGHNDEGNLI